MGAGQRPVSQRVSDRTMVKTVEKQDVSVQECELDTVKFFVPVKSRFHSNTRAHIGILPTLIFSGTSASSFWCLVIVVDSESSESWFSDLGGKDGGGQDRCSV